MSSIADFVSSLRDHNARAPDLLQLKRFRGKVGRGLAVQLSRPRENPTQVKVQKKCERVALSAVVAR